MTYREKILLLLVVVVTAFCFVPRHGNPASQASSPVEVNPPMAASVSVDPPPAAVQVVRRLRHFSPLAATLVSLRLKLQQWQESQIDDPDDESGRAELLQAMLAMVTDANVADIIQSLTPEEMNTPFGAGALHHWMQIDPTSASNWLVSHPDASENQILTVAGDWTSNPGGLQQFINQLSDTPWKQTFLQDASSEMSFKDPLAAVQIAQQMEPGDAMTNLLRGVVSGWIGTDPKGALDWINSVNDPSLREQMIASAAQTFAQIDPAQAATWLVSEVKSEGIVKDSALNILDTWVTTDPAAAASWATQFPDGDTKAAAIKIVATHWQQTDPDNCNAWIQSLSVGPATPAD